jgi:hypothetical protein
MSEKGIGFENVCHLLEYQHYCIIFATSKLLANLCLHRTLRLCISVPARRVNCTDRYMPQLRTITTTIVLICSTWGSYECLQYFDRILPSVPEVYKCITPPPLFALCHIQTRSQYAAQCGNVHKYRFCLLMTSNAQGCKLGWPQPARSNALQHPHIAHGNSSLRRKRTRDRLIFFRPSRARLMSIMGRGLIIFGQYWFAFTRQGDRNTLLIFPV